MIQSRGIPPRVPSSNLCLTSSIVGAVCGHDFVNHATEGKEISLDGEERPRKCVAFCHEDQKRRAVHRRLTKVTHFGLEIFV